MGTVQAVRGMNDILPDRSGAWQRVEGTLRNIFHAYSYYEIRLPLIEKTELFARSIGETTDIVAKEMYTFDDRNGDSLSLRPEGTAGCARAGIERGLFHNQWQRYWYMGPMFRHERPQRGRYRQFYQAGAEAFGWSGPDIDAELIALSLRFWRGMNLQIQPRLEINSLGDTETRARYRRKLVDYLQQYEHELDADSRRRMSSNPLRILDSKDAGTKKILQGAPDIFTCLDAASRSHFDELCDLLQGLEIQFTINPQLVRGLDYYNRTVFEWVTDELGAQSAVCAGGRYDGLVQQLGGKQPVPAAGFALGMDRLVELVTINAAAAAATGPDVYVITVDGQARSLGWKYAELLRDFGINTEMYCGSGVMKKQMKRADKSGALIALLLGEDEIATGSVTLKPMQNADSQITVSAVDLVENVRKLKREHKA